MRPHDRTRSSTRPRERPSSTGRYITFSRRTSPRPGTPCAPRRGSLRGLRRSRTPWSPATPSASPTRATAWTPSCSSAASPAGGRSRRSPTTPPPSTRAGCRRLRGGQESSSAAAAGSRRPDGAHVGDLTGEPAERRTPGEGDEFAAATPAPTSLGSANARPPPDRSRSRGSPADRGDMEINTPRHRPEVRAPDVDHGYEAEGERRAE